MNDVTGLSNDALLLLLVLLGVQELHEVGQRHLGALDVFGVVFLHDLDLDSHHTLLEGDVPGGGIEVVLLGLAGRDHVSLLEFHGLGSLLGKLSGNDDLAALGLFLIDGQLDDGADGDSNGDLVEELQLDRLSHGGGTETLLFESVDLDLDTVILVVEPLLDHGLELLDLPVVVVEEGLGGGDSEDDDGLGEGVGELEARVA